MSAQTAPAHKPGAEPITPVIIKTGGDDDPEHKKLPGHPVTIHSVMPFVETVAGPTWASSQSKSKGRIVELNVTDGSTPLSYNPRSRSKLTSVTIEFGLARLMAMESGLADVGDVLLLLISPEVSFNAGSRDWTKSDARFPQQITRITLMEGDRRAFDHKCESEDVTVQLSFDLGGQ